MIDKKWDFAVFKLSPYLLIGVLAIISMALFTFQIFQFDIKFISNRYFVIVNLSNMNSKMIKAIELIAFSVRDGVFLTIMLFLNVCLYKKFRLAMKKKKNMLNCSTSNQITSLSTISNTKTTDQLSKEKEVTINKANKNLNLMIMCQCFDSTLERVPVFIVFVIKNLNVIDFSDLQILIYSCSIIIQLAYLLKFFIFFFFNSRFRNKLKSFFLKIRP
jgi:hypothetical protein